MAKYYDVLYGKNQLLILWGIVVDSDKITAECGALGGYLPQTIELFTQLENQTNPDLKIALNEFSGIADDGNGLKTNLNFTILKN
jgi:hypothetical protein